MMRAMLLVAGAALTMASPAWAGDKAELACIAQGYSAAQTAEVDSLLGQIDVTGEGDDAALEPLGVLVMSVATGCGATYGWSDSEAAQALLNEFGRLMELGLRRSGALTGSEIAKIDAALANGERAAFWSALEDQLASGMGGEAAELNDADAQLFGSFLAELGFGIDDGKAPLVGNYLAAKAMQRASAREFTAH